MIDEEQPALTSRASYGWKQYHTIDEIYDWLDQMTRRYPRELTNYNIGKTHEKRNIRAVKLSYNPERVCSFKFFIQQKSVNGNSILLLQHLISLQKNPIIFIESTIHAREWITVATATYILNELLTSNDPEVREMATKYDWVFIPVVNVDGYVYSHSSVSWDYFLWFWLDFSNNWFDWSSIKLSLVPLWKNAESNVAKNSKAAEKFMHGRRCES